ncbi:MAG: lipopolysaccharide biosynthesis protein, partial [Actinomycetes bacterium]
MPAATGTLDAAAPGGPPATERPSPSAPDTSVPRGARWLTLASVVVGLLNYAFTLGLTRLMSPVVFGHVAAAQSLILVSGTLATSSVPWVVASVLARQGNDERARGQVIGFSLLVNFGQALVAALVTATLAAPFLPPAALAALVSAVLAVFLATTPAGWLQGMRHFRALAALRVVEVIVKLGAGLALVALAPTATHALLGVFAGSAVIVVVGAWLMRSDLALTSVSLRVGDLWRASLGNVGVQGLVAVLASTDVVLVALLDGGPGAGSYQAATVLARVPVFVAGAVATAVFPHLAAAGGGTGREHRHAQTMYLLLAVGYTIGLVTAPAVLVSSLFPQSYDQVGELLPWLAVSGLSVGLINLVTTYFQAATRYRQSMTVEVVAVVVHVGLLALGFHLGGILGVAIASPVAPTLAAAALLVRAERWA